MYSAREWEDSIPVILHQFRQGTSVRFGLFKDDHLIGVANLTDIKGSPMHGALLGYTLSEVHQGQGYMREALESILDYAFEFRNLHRICANHMPRNERSGKLLRRLGFVVEGYARDYLLINGRWEDHVLTAKLNVNWHQ
jgi:ribosomal-protein-alanine N-acetyltransferase